MSAPLSSEIGNNGFTVQGAAAMQQLARDLHKMSAAQKRTLRKRFREVAQPLLADARRRASWSTRIPDAISVRAIADEARGRIGVQLRVSVKAAPHARAYEGISDQGNAGYFRHPVYGNPDVWRDQPTRPYAAPAVHAHGRAARVAIEAAAEDAAREAGFR